MSPPGDADSRVLSFLHAFTVRGLTFMSGVVSVPLALAALFVPIPVLRILFGGLALAAGCFASYGVWRTEREEVGRLRSQLAGRRAATELKRGLDELIGEG